MSRCGSCDLYWPSEDKNNFGVTCRGDCGVEECADKLQDLVLNLRVESVSYTHLDVYKRQPLSDYWPCYGTGLFRPAGREAVPTVSPEYF